MSAHAQPRLTDDEYLAIERKAELRHQFYDGVMYAMSGASPAHGVITLALASELRNQLKRRPCQVTVSDLRVRVSPRGLYTYPDIVVVCDQPQYSDKQQDTLTNPTLLIEVLSPTTEAYDRGFKFEQYRSIESLREYVLVSQTRPHIEIFRRQPSNEWLLSEFTGMDATCRFDSVGCSIPLAEIYDQIDFEENLPLI